MPIKLPSTGTVEARLRRLEQAVNFRDQVLVASAVGASDAFPIAGKTFGGLSLDRTVFRRLLPDTRWVVYAAGWVNPNDVNTATISLVYEKDDGTQVTLGSTTQAGAGKVKKGLGPFDVFGTAGVPAETIAIVRVKAAKNAGVDGAMEAWTMGFRFLPAQR